MTQTIQKWNGIGLIGFGDLGRQIAMYVVDAFPNQSITIFDDNQTESSVPLGFHCYEFEAYKHQEHRGLGFLVCLGYKHLTLKNKIIGWLAANGCAQPTLIHRTAFVHPTARISPGTVVYPMVNIDKDVSIGPGVVLNNSVVVSHDSKIEACSYLSPGVVLSGKVAIGKECFVGSGSIFANNVIIGDGCVIGVGSVVSRNLDKDTNAIGNPLKIVENKIRLI